MRAHGDGDGEGGDPHAAAQAQEQDRSWRLSTDHIAAHDLIRLRPREGRVVLAYGDTVLSSAADGSIEPDEESGLFVHETRMIAAYRARVAGHRLHPVAQSHIHQHRWLAYFLIVPEASGGREAAQNALELCWGRCVAGGLHEDIDIANYSGRPVELRLSLRWRSDFADLGETQSRRRQHGRVDCRWQRDGRAGAWLARYRKARRWQHQGRGGTVSIDRSVELRLRADSLLSRLGREGAGFAIALRPGERWHACLDWLMSIDGARLPPPPCPCRLAPEREAGEHEEEREDEERGESQDGGSEPAQATAEAFLARSTQFSSEGSRNLAAVVAATLERSRRDLASLRLRRMDRGADAWTVAAGAPAYAAFFGRDAALAAWQSALLAPDLLRGTLATLHDARGRRDDDWRDEQPRRLVHEMRTGPLATLRYTPFGRYYGALNSSTLFPIALLQLWRWHGERERVAALLDTAVGALEWLESDARQGAKGFYAYATRSAQGLENQSWKDSSDALVHADGSRVRQPAAACEEQAEAYRAQLALALLLAEFGRLGEARHWYRRAQSLRERFEAEFWSEELGFYAMALGADGRLALSAGSNPLHCLATGIASPQRARATMRRLLQDDLFSGWGIRTLSSRHPSYNPYAYHRGTVWPAEHGPLALGAMRYGLCEQAQTVCRAMFEAAALFDHNRLPECFAGHARSRRHPFPALYPYTNTPQAWSATTTLSLAQALCGLQALAPRGTLCIDPQLPAWLPVLSLEGLRVGDSAIDLHLRRGPDGATTFEARPRRGELRVERRPLRWPAHASLDELIDAEHG